MCQPPGFIDSAHPKHIYKVHKSLYELKQAPRVWYHALSSSLLDFDFVQSFKDTSLFTLHRGNSHMFVLIYVDNLIITGSNSSPITGVISNLQSHFAIKDLGILSYFLCSEVVSCKEGLFLSQHKYIVEPLQRHHMDGVKS